MTEIPQPIIRHTKTQNTKQLLTRAAYVFLEKELHKAITRLLKTLDGDPFAEESLLPLRKMLRDEARALTVEKDDKVWRLLQTGKLTVDDHPANAVLAAILIHYLVDAQFRDALVRLGEF